MRFALSLSSLLLVVSGAACTAPVEGKGDPDGGIVIPDSGGPDRCRSEQTMCETGGSRECVYLDADEANCGACGNACEPAGEANAIGWTCADPDGDGLGACSCGQTGALCDGSATATCCDDAEGTGCFDLTSTDDHCGSCRNSCIVDREVADHCENSRCVCGELDTACEGSLESTCCMDDVETGAGARCADLLSSEQDCGACGAACQPPMGDRCRNGQCVCGPGTPEVAAEACAEGMECCGSGDAATCVAAGSCG
jgi:hypothetical protein